MNLRKAVEMALKHLETVSDWDTTYPIGKAKEALRQALANEFNPDWNQVEALQESLREHMAEIQRLRQALSQINPNRGSGYAGVKMWIGDKTIQYLVTKTCVEQELIEGMSMKLAADSCLKALKEKNT